MESLLKRIERNRREHDRLIALILCLSLIVSMGTFAVFHKKAVAKTYIRQVLDCPLATEDAGLVVHTHNDDCFDENHNLVCTLPELEAHTHTDACYTEVPVQVCGLAESVGHIHGSDCRTLMLTCEEEEREATLDEEGNVADPGHIHTPDCYSEVLSCGMEEGDGAHTHTDACYETEYVLACDKPEVLLHVHTDDCYQKNEDGSIYVDEDGFSWLICGLPEIIQHAHGPECFKIYELDDGEPEEADEIVAADEIAAEPAEDTDTAESIDEEKTNEEESGDEENTELTETEEAKETTNTEDMTVPAVLMPAQSWERTAGGIKVTVEAPEGAFPEDTRIAVTPVNGSSLMDTVSDAVNGEVLEVQAVDITFFDANGREIEPVIPIRVSMTPAATEHAEEKTNVVHIDLAQQTAEVIEQAEGTETDNSEVVFDAEAFTIYAIVYTVHFEYEVNGQVYTSTVPGAQDKLLSELIRELNVVNEEQLPEFMTKIREVSFSNPEVLKITETEGNWIIRPLKDSDQKEGLTIVMQDGATFRITVEAEGITEVSDENEVATVSTVNDLYLPASSEVKAELLTEEQSGNAIAAVQSAESSSYQTFSIALENVDVTAYDGFNVAVTLPEDAVIGRDFQLYRVKEDGSSTDLTESLTVTGETNEDGLQNVSGISFTTEDFADFVLGYSIETFYTTAAGDTYRITLNYGPKAGIPDGADLKVKEILPEDESYTNYLNESAAKLGVPCNAVSFARFFDIEIRKDDEKIEPKAPVQVTISLTDAPEENVPEDLKVLHFAQTGLETIDGAQAEQKEDATIDLIFETDGFSVYGVVYTVDFHYEINGKVYDFSIPGGGFISLEHLIEVLGINAGDADSKDSATGEAAAEENYEGSLETVTASAKGIAEAEIEAEAGSEDDSVAAPTTSNYEQAINLNSVPVSEETRAFVENIETVEFSSPELVWVGKTETESTVRALKEANGLEIEYSANLTEEQIAEINAQTVEAGDWALISLKAFDTEETLTVTMKTGEVFQITVTDDQENPLGLDGKSFAITAYKNSNNTYYYITTDGTGISSSNPNCLNAYTFNPSSGGTPQGSAWTFEWTGDGKKYLIHDAQNRYILVENDKVSLTDRDTALANPITVISKNGKYSFVNEKNNHALNIFGNSGFGSWTYSASNSDFLMTLQNPSNLKTPGTIATADTSGVLQINLFDYGPENELDREANNNSSPYAYGINDGHILKFFSYGKNVGSGINDFTGAGNGPQTGIVADQLSGDYPVLASNPSESLNYLFGGAPNSYVTGYYGLNHLFTKDENGYYHYNSDQNYAYLNGSDFEVYSKTFPEEGADEQYFGVGFFPFNPYNEYYNCIHGKDGFERWSPHSNGTDKSGHYDHHFGMSLTGNFIMPPGGQYNGEDVTFQFSGDDDMWVFVDGVLIMDIGGIHNPVHGEVNFTTGEVTVHGAAQENFKEKYKRLTGKDWDDSDYSNHDFRVFYMERGGMYSNLEVTFNLPLTPETEIGDFSFDKVSAKNESLKLPGAEFSLFTDSECREPFTLATVPVKTTSGDNGVVSFTNIPYGEYYMKETAYPIGYQAKTPEEVFTVVVGDSGTTIRAASGESITKVTNQPQKTDVEVEKLWENGSAPANAQVEVVLGRYKLVEDPNAPGTATLVIRDSYTGLPSGSNYHVTYTINGLGEYSKTITKSFTDGSKSIEETVEVPAAAGGSQYTVTKQVQNISYHNINNQNQTVSVTLSKNGTGQVEFNQSTFNRNAYRVRIYAVNGSDPNNLYSENYYPAGSQLALRIEHNAYNWGFFSFTVSSNTGWTSSTYSSDSQQQFISNLSQDIDLVLHCSDSKWTKAYDWIKDPYITGADPLRTNSASRMMMSARRGGISLTASAPTLPTPPKDTVYEPDKDYAKNPDKITLTGNQWTGKAEGLDAYNELGPYVYYIAEINETGMPDGTTVTIEDEVTFDGNTKVLTVTNKLPDTGSLKIRKTFEGLKPVDLTPAQKESITFTIQGPDNYSKTIKLSELNENLEMTISGLSPGEYTVVETRPDNSTPSGYRWISTTYSVESGKTTVNKQETAEVTVTNTYQRVTNITLKKVDIGDLNNDSANLLKGAAFTLTRFTNSSFNEIDPDTKTNFSQTLADVKKDDGTYTLNGIFTFKDVPVGYYKITEAVLPAGYVKSGEDPAFEIKTKPGSETELEVILYQKNEQGTYEPVGSGPTALVRVASENTLIIGNAPGVALPNTGGSGTGLFTLIGGILSATAGAILTLTSHRRRKKQYT